MDKLSHMICDEVGEGVWKPILIANSGPAVSHLMFADDLLLFGKATENHAKCMIRCLDRFCLMSGAKVSRQKSSVYFSPRVPVNTKQNISSITGMRISTEIGRYLGVSLSRRRKPSDTYHYIIDRVKGKLVAWKEKKPLYGGQNRIGQLCIKHYSYISNAGGETP
ncbi:hypothetical protein QN277_018129 [Acacia crassicarpa]|uniref:Reverse transcriptase domain-containing protein n=1 Tax=Acacia crassicarpa TaxID=499986 RepID=A0AAE1JVM0_9FABA|nr:hypothetical protein QN277_018129 [Acacia crassicarpa]